MQAKLATLIRCFVPEPWAVSLVSRDHITSATPRSNLFTNPAVPFADEYSRGTARTPQGDRLGHQKADWNRPEITALSPKNLRVVESLILLLGRMEKYRGCA